MNAFHIPACLRCILLGICLPYGASAQFDDHAAAWGLGSTLTGGAQFGNGVSFCDFDGDGWDDLSFGTSEGLDLIFYKNVQGVYQPADLPISVTDDTKQILWVDYDNDGDKDLYTANHGAVNHLFRNDGDLQFTDVTEAAGLPLIPDLSYGAAFGDYDNDGFLDIYISNRDNSAAGHTNRLYRNKGDGTFEDVSIASQTFDGKRTTFCAAWFDYDKDGDQDLYLAQDRLIGNVLFRNNGDGTFSNVGNASNSNKAMNAMNVGVADYDNDQDLDIYVTNTPVLGNELFRNEGDGTFTEQAANSGTTFNYIGWGASFFDRDNDGDLDLYVCSMKDSISEPNLLYDNNGDGTFTKPYPQGFVGDTATSFAVAVGDPNQDGRQDLIVSNQSPYPAMLWLNSSPAERHLRVDLRGVDSNRDGIGAWVRAFANGQVWTRYTMCGEAYLGQNSNTQHFGLGPEDRVDSLVITWPSGAEDVIPDIGCNQMLRVVEHSSGGLSDSWQYLEASVEGGEVQLYWEVTDESIADRFIIQRGASRYRFETVDQRLANSGNDFAYMDSDIDDRQSYYYRVVLVCKDGRREYSPIRMAHIAPEGITVGEPFPNPSEGYFQIPYYAQTTADVTLSIYAADGRLAGRLSRTIQAGEGTLQLDAPHLKRGMYFIRIPYNGICVTKRVFLE